MKVRNSFVSNSSSTSFIITNTSNSKKTLVDFVEENPQILKEFTEEYGSLFDLEEYERRFTEQQMIAGAKAEDIEFKPFESVRCVFGDEEGTVIGEVYDYMLREGGKSKSFSWRLDEYLR